MIDDAIHRFTEDLGGALTYAADAHAYQGRGDSGTAYIQHPVGVMSLVIKYGGDELQAIAAVLHDVVEDCGGIPRLIEIRNQFGAEVARMVLASTDSFTNDPEKKLDWWQRKVAYLKRMEIEHPRAALVTGADKLYNAENTVSDHRIKGTQIWDNFNTGRVGQLWYYGKISNILPIRLAATPLEPNSFARPNAILLGKELTRTVGDMYTLAMNSFGLDQLDADLAQGEELAANAAAAAIHAVEAEHDLARELQLV